MRQKILFVILCCMAVFIARSQTLQVNDITIPPGEESDLVVRFNFDRTNTYTSYSFDLALPEGVELATDIDGEYSYTLGDAHASSHQLTINHVQTEGVYAVACLSIGSDALIEKSGILLTLKVKATQTLSNQQTLAAKLQKAKLFPTDGSSGIPLADASFNITLSVPSPITITVMDCSRKYGENNPTFGYTVEGGIITGTPAITCSATKTSPVGEYTITIKAGTVSYPNLILNNGTLTITKATLTATAKSYTRMQGEQNPNLEITYSGFKNNETENVLTKKPVATTTATSSSPAGTYTINVSGGEAQNYVFNYVDGTLTVIAATPIEPEPYATLTENGTKLTFFYDKDKDSREGTKYALNTGTNKPGWYDKRANIISVVFNSSFAGARPTTCYNWFSEMNNLTTIEGLEYLNTSNVTDMGLMFCECSSLTSLDVSTFNTSNVTDMYLMFGGCSSLTSLDVSTFNTSNVTNMVSMFGGCSSLTSLDVSTFNTSNVTEMGYMFGVCSSLRRLYISSTMEGLSDSACYGVGTEESPCRLHAPEGFDLGVIDTSGTFQWKGGWFTLGEGEKNDYLVLSDDGASVTFYYDGKKAQRNGIDLATYEGLDADAAALVTKVVFDPSFIEARPKSTYHWFYNMVKLASIEGMEYLNTSEVTTMRAMFSQCSKLEAIDLSHFDTSKVNNMRSMFYGCSGLKFIDLSKFDTSSVTTMYSMFNKCSGLTSLDLSKFDTSNVTTMYSMFYGCSGLTSLDLSKFDTSRVTTMYNMFNECKKLTSLNLGSFDTSKVKSMYCMFNRCTSLASIDLGNFNTSEVTSMYAMFNECSSLSSIDVSGFNTSKVNSMYVMFNECTSLKTLNLSNFDTSKATNTSYMFDNCHSLESIIISGTMGNLNANAFGNVGTEENPCLVTAPEGFDFGVDTSGGSFLWKGGWFRFGNTCVLTAEAGKLLAGGTAPLVLSLENGQQGISAIQCQIVLPGGVTIATEGNNFLYTVAERCHGSLVQIVETMDGHYNLMMFHLSDESFSGSSGPIITLTLRVDEDLSDMESEGRVDYIILTNTAREMLEAAPATFPISVSNHPFGDVNHDGDVNVVDVMMTVDYVLGKNVSNFHEENADVNGDGYIDVADVMGIVNIVLYTIPSQAPALTTADELTATPTSSCIDLRLDNAARYTAMEATLTLTNGARLAKASLENTTAGHRVDTYHLGNGKHRIVVYSFTGEPLPEGEALLHLDIWGDGNVTVGDVVLASTLHEALTPGETTAIVNIPTENDGNGHPSYRINGTQTIGQQRGVVIKNGKKQLVGK